MSLWSNEVHVLDGGLGSLLARLGYDINTSPIWSGGAVIDRPDLVRRCHEMFIEAGATVIMTNTYHCCIQMLMESMGLPFEHAEGVLAEAVKLARDAIGGSSNSSVKLVGSIGPYATYFRDGSEYTGAYTKKPGFNPKIIVDYYMAQTGPLIRSGVKCIAFETIPTLLEVESIREIAKTLPDDVEVWISVTCKDGKTTGGGDDFPTVVKTASSIRNVQCVGINCTSPLHVTELLNGVVEAGVDSKAFVIYPNSGETYDGEGKRWHLGDRKVDPILDQMSDWYRLGARIFGGCCNVFPEDIKRIAVRCEEIKRSNAHIEYPAVSNA